LAVHKFLFKITAFNSKQRLKTSLTASIDNDLRIAIRIEWNLWNKTW